MKCNHNSKDFYVKPAFAFPLQTSHKIVFLYCFFSHKSFLFYNTKADKWLCWRNWWEDGFYFRLVFQIMNLSGYSKKNASLRDTYRYIYVYICDFFYIHCLFLMLVCIIIAMYNTMCSVKTTAHTAVKAADMNSNRDIVSNEICKWTPSVAGIVY